MELFELKEAWISPSLVICRSCVYDLAIWQYFGLWLLGRGLSPIQGVVGGLTRSSPTLYLTPWLYLTALSRAA